MIAYLTDGALAMGIDHILYGWIFFGIVTLLLFWFGSRWRERDAPDAAAAPGPPEASGPGRPAGRPAVAFAVAIAVLLAAPRAAARLGAADPADPAVGSIAPSPAAGWSGPYETADDWRPQFERPAGERRAAYVRGSEQVQFYAAVYGRQRQGAELISSMNRVYDPDGWRRVGERTREVMVDGRPLRVIETSLLLSGSGSARRRTAWHWYVVSGEPTTDPYVAKLLEAKARLTGGWDGSAVIALAADERSRPGAAEEILASFVRAHSDAIRRSVGPAAADPR
jgi:EpsI family protein